MIRDIPKNYPNGPKLGRHLPDKYLLMKFSIVHISITKLDAELKIAPVDAANRDASNEPQDSL